MEKIPKRFWADSEWGMKNLTKLRRRYKDTRIGIVNKKVVSYGDSPALVRKNAKQKTGKKHVPVLFVEGDAHIY